MYLHRDVENSIGSSWIEWGKERILSIWMESEKTDTFRSRYFYMLGISALTIYGIEEIYMVKVIIIYIYTISITSYWPMVAIQ